MSAHPHNTGTVSQNGGGMFHVQPAVNSEEVLAEVICAIADFAVDLAQTVAQKTGNQWTPKILTQQKKKSRRPPTVAEDPNKPRKPPSAYNLWSEHIRAKVREKDPSQALFVKDLAKMWNELTDDEKAPWERKSLELKQKYQQDMMIWKSGIHQGGYGAQTETDIHEPVCQQFYQ